MKKIVLLLFVLLFTTSCDNVLNGLDTINTDTNVIEPYEIGDTYSVIYSQTYNASLNILIKEGDRLLSEKLIGVFSDSTMLQKEYSGSLILPNKIGSYTIVDEYSGKSSIITINPANGKYIYIVCSTTSIFTYQDKIYKSTGKL